MNSLMNSKTKKQKNNTEYLEHWKEITYNITHQYIDLLSSNLIIHQDTPLKVQAC